MSVANRIGQGKMDNEVPTVGMGYEEDFFVNSRGLKLFTCAWLPIGKEIRALIFLCHGYGVECSVYMKEIGLRLAGAKYAVFGIDVEGHGKSQGLRCCINNFSYVVDDCASFFKSVRDRQEYRNKPRFLYGESMGGATALLIHRKEPEEWNGAVLLAPMCKISQKVMPSQIVTYILKHLANVFPNWKLVPATDIVTIGFRDPLKREKIRSNPYLYNQDKPRLKTGLEMLNVCADLEGRLDEVKLPFLLLHGEDDAVTDPEISKEMYEKAQSTDKTLKLYPGMWHGLISGEPDENAEEVWRDILTWLDERSSTIINGSAMSSPLRQADLSQILQQELAAAPKSIM